MTLRSYWLVFPRCYRSIDNFDFIWMDDDESMSSFNGQATGWHNGEPYHTRHPADALEPISSHSDDLRDTRLRFLEIILSWSALIHRAFSEPNPSVGSIAARCYGVMFAIGAPCLEGVGMTDIADRFNL